LAAAMRAGHWRWHFTGIGREIHFPKPLIARPRPAVFKNGN
jgi:hypothetical protein